MNRRRHKQLRHGNDVVSESLKPRVRRWSGATYIGLLAAITLAAGLRLYGLGHEDYWLDELHSLANSAGRRAEFEALPHGVILESVPRFTDLTPDSTWCTAWQGVEVDGHPPLYFVLLFGWRRIFGDGEFAVRLLPTLFSALSILPVALIFRVYGRPRLGVGVACLLAVSFCHMHMAQENRPYSLGLLFVSISYWAFVKMEVGWGCFGQRQKCLWGIIYGVAVYLAMMTHYFTGLALLGQVVLVAVRVRGLLLRSWILMVTAAAMAFAVTWGRQFYGQLDFIFHQDWVLEQREDHTPRTILRFMDLPIRLLFTHERFQFNYLFSFVGVSLLLGALLSAWRHKCGEAITFVAWYLMPVAAFTVVDLATEKQLLTYVRYMSIAVPGLVGMIALAAQRLRPTLLAIFVAGFALAVVWPLKLPTQYNPKNRRAAKLIAEQVKPGDLLIYDATDWPPFSASRIYHNVSYYLPAYLTIPHPSFVLLREQPDAALLRDMASYERIIVVTPRVEEIPNPFPGRYQLLDQTGYVRNVGFIYLFTRS